MADLTKYIGRGRFRMSRKKAVARNVVILLAFAFAMAWLVRSYAAAGTPEQAVKEWCSRNFFGEAAVDSICTYTMNDTEHQDVYISKTDEDGNRYEATIYLEKKNPLKWISTGSAYRKGPCTYDMGEDQVVLEKDEKTVTMKGNFSGLFSELVDSYTGTAVLTQDEGGKKLLQVEIGYLARPIDRVPTTCIEFQVDLDSGSCTYSKFLPIRKNSLNGDFTAEPTDYTYDLYISGERMVFMAETIYEILCEKKLVRWI